LRGGGGKEREVDEVDDNDPDDDDHDEDYASSCRLKRNWGGALY